MKIVIITPYWKNSDGGGIKTYLVNLVDTLKKMGIEVSVLYRRGDDAEQFCGGKNKIMFAFNCYKQLRKIRPDVIHSQESWYCLLPGVLYKKIHGCMLVHTFHTEPNKMLPLLEKIVFQSLINTCDCLTFVSKGLQKRFVELDDFTFPRTVITYAGVQNGEISDDQVERFRKQYGISKDAVVLLAQAMTANPLKAEGLKLLIQAAQILRETYPNIVLVATREGKYSEMVKVFARELNMDKHVVFTGNVENPFIPLGVCDFYTHITLSDGLPLSLLEAMVMGKPIVATRIGGIPEAIENGFNGFLVEPDPAIIAERIIFLLKNPDISDKISRNAQFTVKTKFTWDNAAKTFISLYRGEC